jgi:hypothetical protein
MPLKHEFTKTALKIQNGKAVKPGKGKFVVNT